MPTIANGLVKEDAARPIVKATAKVKKEKRAASKQYKSKT